MNPLYLLEVQVKFKCVIQQYTELVIRTDWRYALIN